MNKWSPAGTSHLRRPAARERWTPRQRPGLRLCGQSWGAAGLVSCSAPCAPGHGDAGVCGCLPREGSRAAVPQSREGRGGWSRPAGRKPLPRLPEGKSFRRNESEIEPGPFPHRPARARAVYGAAGPGAPGVRASGGGPPGEGRAWVREGGFSSPARDMRRGRHGPQAGKAAGLGRPDPAGPALLSPCWARAWVGDRVRGVCARRVRGVCGLPVNSAELSGGGA